MQVQSTKRLLTTGLLLLLAMSGSAFAQEETGNVYVEVTDSEGLPLPGVTVELAGIGAPRLLVTTAEGQARFLGLDPGDWSLKASLDGYSTVEYPRINVRVARSTTVEVELSANVREVITVTSESPLLDEKRVAAGTTISQIELEKIPTARDPWAVLSQTPGVMVDRINVGGNESGQQAVFLGPGLGDAENTFLVDGVEVTDMSAIGSSSTYYDFDQFTEMQFATGGTDATKTAGGVSVNLVTKRGTNDFRGSARFLVTDSDSFLFVKQSGADIADGDLGPGQEQFIGNSISKIEEWGFEAGGPVLRDKLWFWGSHGQNDIKNLTGGNTPADVQSDDTILTNTAFKLNAQITDSNSAQGSWNNGDKEKFGRNASPTRPAPTTWDQRGPSAIIKFEDTHLFSPSFFLSGTYNKVDGGFQLISKAVKASGNDAPQAHLGADGVWQGSFWSGTSARPSEELKADGSYFFNTGDMGHELKFGARLREFERTSTFGWSNDDAWSIDTGSGFTDAVLITQRGSAPPLTQEYTSLWVQDTIAAGNWTINAGFRYDLQEGTNDAVSIDGNPWFPSLHPALDYPGADAPFDWETISPRVGVTYALGEERKTLLRASYSRFPEQLEDDEIQRTNPALGSYLTLSWTDLDGSGDFNGADVVLRPDGSLVGPSGRPGPDSVVLLGTSGFDLDNPVALVSPNRTDPGLDAELTDELILGAEHAFLPEFVAGVSFTYRNVSDVKERRAFVRDAAGNVRTALASDYVPDQLLTGTLPDGSAYEVQSFALDPALAFTGGTLLLNGDREREYQGLGVNFTKRLSNRWMMRGYFQYGEAEWDVPSGFFANQSPNLCEDTPAVDAGPAIDCNGLGAGFFDGGLFAVQSGGSGAKGDVYIQSTWQFNVNGMYQVAPDRPWGFNVAANLFGREGYPLPYYEDVLGADGQDRDILVVDAVDRVRADDIFTVDLRLDKEFAATDSVSFTVGLDAFNLLNENYVLQRERGLNRTTADFLRETLSPRIWRLSARLSWK